MKQVAHTAEKSGFLKITEIKSCHFSKRSLLLLQQVAVVNPYR